MMAAFDCVPALQDADMTSHLHGPDTHSPDHNFVLGPMHNIINGYVCSGFNSQGIQSELTTLNNQFYCKV